MPIADIFVRILSPDYFSTSGTVFETITEAGVQKLNEQPKHLKLVVSSSKTSHFALIRFQGIPRLVFDLFVSFSPFSDAQKIKNQLEKIFNRVGRIGKTIIFSEILTVGAGYLDLQTPGFRNSKFCFVRLLEAFVSIPLCNSPPHSLARRERRCAMQMHFPATANPLWMHYRDASIGMFPDLIRIPASDPLVVSSPDNLIHYR